VSPGRTVELVLEVMAVGACGWVGLPKVRIWEGEGEDREELDVVVVDSTGERVEVAGPKVYVRP